ncbi:ROK family protein [Isoptericola sp. BMS4]|uniref:ROK family protein n=1 Tax=Isoptericola sp. BMS4 TaxID=2527875 RepID=UPI00141ED346|nr:ROK family protein [Isoptericola sp. BMS4]
MTEPRLLLGIDLGGTSTKLLLETDDGTTVDRAQVATPRGPALADDLVAAVVGFLGGRAVAGAGLTVPGLVDPDGTVLACVNLPWIEGHDLGARLAGVIGAPVRTLNDGEASAGAEALRGAGRGHDDVYVVALGTGIAGKHVVGGTVQRGAHLAAGEIGHLSLDPHGAPCSCGQRGCLETFIGGPHLVRRWHQAGQGRARDAVAAGTDPDPGAQAVVDAARQGDAAARDVAATAVDALAAVLLGVVATLDPGLIVIGGGLAQAEDVIVAPARDAVRRRATFHHVPPVVTAELGPWAGAAGAALAARAVVDDEPAGVLTPST